MNAWDDVKLHWAWNRAQRLLACMLLSGATHAATLMEPEGLPAASIDLASSAGVQQVQGQWRYSDARIVSVAFRAAGSDGQPGSQIVMTNEITPHAGAADFDDSAWQRIKAEDLQARRGNGRLSFNWYRLTLTVPENVDGVKTAGTTVVFTTSLDDYAEVWVDGELPRAPAQSGGSMVRGWNADNRLVIARDVTPGRKIQLAVFGANGPLSSPPTNYIWVRHARLEFYPDSVKGPYAVPVQEVNVEVLRKDAALDAIVPANPKVFKLAEGFQFTEGPVWVREGGYLLFSDPNHNTIYKYHPEQGLSVFRDPSGYSGADIAAYKQPGSNGLAIDLQGRLSIDQHGNRRVIRLEKDGAETVLAERHEGKRLNSPNDLVYRSDGVLFFTDPPFGLPKVYDDPRKELAYSGVYCVRDGATKLLDKSLAGPNGIAFSPDEKYLYVGNWDERRKVVMRYRAAPDCTLSDARVFIDMTEAPGEDAIDGIKVDSAGNLFVSGPGGLWVISPAGKHLGTIITPRHVHNMAWGDADGRSLYLAARDRLYRMRLNVPGARQGE